MSILLVTIATGEKYHKYAHEMISSAAVHFPSAHPLVFTDAPQYFAGISPVSFTEAKGFPNETLYRYHTFLSRRHLFESFDHIFYVDADMRFVAPVKPDDVISDGITATLHPGLFVAHNDRDGSYVPTCGTPERANLSSRAYIPRGTDNHYFCGGFNGGATSTFLKMAETIKSNIDWDKENWGLGYMPIWHDESYLNRYLYDNPPARVLTPSFCSPEDYDGGYGWAAEKYPPILVALNKMGIRE